MDIKVLKSATLDEGIIGSYVIAVVDYETEHGGKILAKIDLNKYLFDQLYQQMTIARDNWGYKK